MRRSLLQEVHKTAPQFQALSQLVTSFEPHLYEVVFVDEAVAE
jgi:hypothetical protein